MDPSKHQYLEIDGPCENGDDHLHVYVTVPNNNFTDNVKDSRLIVYLPSVGSGTLYQDMTGKHMNFNYEQDVPQNGKWVFETCYTISLNWGNGNKDWEAYQTPPNVHFRQVLAELTKIFEIKERRFVAGFSRGALSTWDVIETYPHFSSTYLLAAPYLSSTYEIWSA